MGDIIEAQAIGAVFGQSSICCRLEKLYGTYHGRLRSHRNIIGLYMMHEGFVAPTLNLEEIDERCAMIKHVQKLIRASV